MDRRLRLVRGLCDVVAVGAALGMIAGRFPVEHMLADTVTAGGDMASHYYAAAYMRDVLLPKGQVTGWCPGNYAGLPLFQFYFFLPFLLIALVSYLVPLTIAFKIGTVLGTFLLPICAYGALRIGGRRRFPRRRSPRSRRSRSFSWKRTRCGVETFRRRSRGSSRSPSGSPSPSSSWACCDAPPRRSAATRGPVSSSP
jgi:hypothetical protein